MNKPCIKNLVVLAGLFLLAGGVGYAQTSQSPQELRSDIWVSGTLRAGGELWYSVKAAQTGFITVETSGDTDTYLEAYDASRNLIGVNDDGPDEYNARIEVFGETGKTYIFKLRCYDEDESGDFRIRAVSKPVPQAAELRFGSSLQANLRAGDEHWYSVKSAQTGIVSIETSGDTDTYLEAYDDAYKLLASDDDGGEEYNARLDVLVEGGKIYRFRLKAYGSGDSGPYRIWTSFENIPPDTERNTERSRAVPLRLGEAFQGFFRSGGESRWYRYDVSKAGTLFFAQTRGSLDTIIILYDAQGRQIEEDDDGGEGSNALVSARLGAGTVYIEVKEYSKKTGIFTLHAEIR